MNWWKRYKDRNWYDVMYSDEWTLKFKSSRRNEIDDERLIVCGTKEEVYSFD